MDAAAISFAARLVVAGVLLIAAIAKLRAPAVTRRQTVALIGDALGPGVALALPAVEVTVAVLLVVWWSAVPGVIAAMLFGAFTVIVVRAQLRGLPCPCFGGGTAETETRPPALVRNGLLLGYAVLATASPAGAHPAAVVLATVVLGSGAAAALRLASRQRAVNRPN
jgi:hypothetical protein